MKAFILAGGFATRLWPLTEKRAKPLLPLAGKPLLDHILEKIPAEIPITVSTNAAFKEGFEEWRNGCNRKNVEILIEDTSHDDHKLGALGAVAQWVKDAKISDDVLLLTGDNYFGFQIADFINAQSEDTAILAAHDINDIDAARSFGTVIVGNDKKTITAFEEKPENPTSTLVSTGCSILPASTLQILIDYAASHPDNVGGIFEELLRKEKPVECFTFSEPWFDIGSFDAYLEATRTLVGENVIEEEGAKDRDATLNGSIVLGKGSTVQNSTLKDVVLFENCIIEDCELENCILDNNCELRGVDLSGKMLREGTKLAKN